MKSEVAKSSVETGVQQELISQMNKYKQYRNSHAMNIVFDPAKADLSEYVKNKSRQSFFCIIFC